jgi:exosortase/archaeosortase family protein
MHYDVNGFLGDKISEENKKRLEDGEYINCYLSPKDYHRFHIPCDLTVRKAVHIPGKLYPVNIPYLNKQPNLFIENERVVIECELENKKIFYMVLVGALNVGVMQVAFEPAIKTNASATEVTEYVYEEGIYWLTKIQLELSGLFLSLFGYDYTIIGKVISVGGSGGVLLDRGCLGRNVLGLFFGGIWSFPSSFRDKLPISVIGFGVFILLNVLRITALAIIDYCCPQYLDINHHYIFKVIVYAAILFMWWLWLRSLRFKQPQEP